MPALRAGSRAQGGHWLPRPRQDAALNSRPHKQNSHLPHCPPSDDTPKKQRDQERQNTVSGYFLMLTAHPLLMAFPCHIPGELMPFTSFFFLCACRAAASLSAPPPASPSSCQHPGRPLGDKHRTATGFNTAAFKDKVLFSSPSLPQSSQTNQESSANRQSTQKILSPFPALSHFHHSRPGNPPQRRGRRASQGVTRDSVLTPEGHAAASPGRGHSKGDAPPPAQEAREAQAICSQAHPEIRNRAPLLYLPSRGVGGV